jgi:biotin operon repressor
VAIFVFKDYHEPERPTRPNAVRASAPATSRPAAAPAAAQQVRRAPRIAPPVTQVYDGELTPRQMAVFRQMLAFQEEHGHAPTQSELSARMGMRSEQGVKAHLAVLEAKGYVVTTQKHGHRNKMAVWPEG